MMPRLLAQESFSRVEYLRSLQNRFSQSEPDLGWKILSLIAALVAVLGLVALLNRIQSKKDSASVEKPQRLFFKAMKNLQLTWRDRWRLWSVAVTLHLEHPAALLISPNYYDAAVQDYRRKSALFGNRPSTQRRLHELRRRLFSETPASSPT